MKHPTKATFTYPASPKENDDTQIITETFHLFLDCSVPISYLHYRERDFQGLSQAHGLQTTGNYMSAVGRS